MITISLPSEGEAVHDLADKTFLDSRNIQTTQVECW
jgi:hypothetical protein